MKRYAIEVLDQKQIDALCKDKLLNNDYICETAGFEPLEVRLKRFEMQGQLMQAYKGEITSSDLREMYLNPDYSLSLDDEPDEIFDKMAALQAHIREIKAKAHERTLKAAGANAPKARQAVSAAADDKDDSEKEE